MDFLRPENLLRFGYKDCLLCDAERKGEERRCRDCSGRRDQRDRLLWEIRRRLLRRAAGRLSCLYPGLGHLYAGRTVAGLFWACLIPLALGLAVNTWSGPSIRETAAVLRGDAVTTGKMVLASGELLAKVPGGEALAREAGVELSPPGGEAPGEAPAGGTPPEAATGITPPAPPGESPAGAPAAEAGPEPPSEAELGAKVTSVQAGAILLLLVWQSVSYGHIFLLVSFAFIYWISWQDAKRGTNEKVAPCEAACPSGVRIPDYIALIREGMPLEALALVHDRLPFAAFCGRACPHPCEQSCVRNEWEAPISIMCLKRYAADLGYSQGILPPPGEAGTGPRVAIVGAGAAGLSAANTLARLGAVPVLFDENEEPGGTLRYGVVDFRYPAAAMDDDVRGILARGARFEGGKRAGVDFTLASLQADGFEAVLVATGTTTAFRLPGAGTEEEGFLDALTFLGRAARGRQPRLRGSVVVVGGGNVAMDVARTAIRLGAEELTVLCLESRETMPAFAWEVVDAEEEGARILPSTAVKRFVVENGRLAGFEALKVERITFDEKKRIVPHTVPGSEFQVRVDTVIMAIGSRADLSFLPDGAERLPADRKHHVYRLQFKEKEITIPVYACGDCVRGPATVVEASASGREAGLNIYGALRVEEVRQVRFRDNYRRRNEPQVSDRPSWRLRMHPDRLRPAEARDSFEEVERRFTEEAARHEAERCARCNLCL